MESTSTAKKTIFNLDVVAHSMGFAYAQGFIARLKASRFSEQLRYKGYYIIAPENAETGSIDPADWKDQVWQYGSDEATTALYDQDGVAPQKAVQGINGGDPTKNGRAYIPNEYATPRQVELYVMPTLANPNPQRTYTFTEQVPKGFKDSHSIGNYGWIFERGPNDNGHVQPK
jgi:hypothetical protein